MVKKKSSQGITKKRPNAPPATSGEQLPHPVPEAVQVAKITSDGAVKVALIGACVSLFSVVVALVTGVLNQGQRNAAVTPAPAGPTPVQTRAQDDGQSKKVIMLGSGTVYKYFKEHKIVEGLTAKGFDVPILEGPTETAAKLFASAFEGNTILVMAADALDDQLRQHPPAGHQPSGKPTGEQPGLKPEAVFEIYLGADPLKLFLVAGSEGGIRREVGAYFPEVFGATSKNASDEYTLDFKKIFEMTQWPGGYNFYSGSEESGTTKLWKKRLSPEERRNAWPSVLKFWDIRTPVEVNLSREPRIYLGSKVLNQNLKIHLDPKVDRKEIYMVSGSEQVRRGLYLYGYINKNNKTSNEKGFVLPEEVRRILNVVLDALEESLKDKSHPLNLIRAKCIEAQRTHFHLRSPVAWVPVTPPPRNIYRAPECEGRPEEEAPSPLR